MLHCPESVLPSPFGMAGYVAPLLPLPWPKQTKTRPALKELAVMPIDASKWHQLGLALGLRKETLELIRQEHTNAIKCKWSMFRNWLDTAEAPTWSAVLKALEDTGQKEVAEIVKREYNLQKDASPSVTESTADSSQRPHEATQQKDGCKKEHSRRVNTGSAGIDGKSPLELTKEFHHSEIAREIERHTAITDTEDPFLQLLSSYLKHSKAKSTSDEATPQTHAPKPAPKKWEESTAKKDSLALSFTEPTPPGEASTLKDQLKKASQRVADLETRVHNLTLQSTVEISDDSHLDCACLETEFREMKELKKKAEQYGLEAKQTAQRLSAENFRLKEDLTRERHYNELTRKSMIREMEQKMDKRATKDERKEAEKEKNWTALFYAIHSGHPRLVKELLLAGADTNVRDMEATTPSHIPKAAPKKREEATAKKDSFAFSFTKPTPLDKTSTLKVQLKKEISSLEFPENSGTHLEMEFCKMKGLNKKADKLEEYLISPCVCVNAINNLEVSDNNWTHPVMEYRKMKELKEAEQCAIEAKQTAQRLSAENFKLKTLTSKNGDQSTLRKPTQAENQASMYLPQVDTFSESDKEHYDRQMMATVEQEFVRKMKNQTKLPVTASHSMATGATIIVCGSKPYVRFEIPSMHNKQMMATDEQSFEQKMKTRIKVPVKEDYPSYSPKQVMAPVDQSFEQKMKTRIKVPVKEDYPSYSPKQVMAPVEQSFEQKMKTRIKVPVKEDYPSYSPKQMMAPDEQSFEQKMKTRINVPAKEDYPSYSPKQMVAPVDQSFEQKMKTRIKVPVKEDYPSYSPKQMMAPVEQSFEQKMKTRIKVPVKEDYPSYSPKQMMAPVEQSFEQKIKTRIKFPVKEDYPSYSPNQCLYSSPPVFEACRVTTSAVTREGKPTLDKLAVIPLHSEKWNYMGEALGLNRQTLDLIHQQHHGHPNKCKWGMFSKWLEVSSNPTWTAVIEALGKIDQPDTAELVKSEYGIHGSVSPSPPIYESLPAVQVETGAVFHGNTGGSFYVDKPGKGDSSKRSAEPSSRTAQEVIFHHKKDGKSLLAKEFHHSEIAREIERHTAITDTEKTTRASPNLVQRRAWNPVVICDTLKESEFLPNDWHSLATRLIEDPDSIACRKRTPSDCLIETIRQWRQKDMQASWVKLAHEVSKVDGYGAVTEQNILKNAGIVT